MPSVNVSYNEAYSSIQVPAHEMSVLGTSSVMKAMDNGLTDFHCEYHEYEVLDKFRNSDPPQLYTLAGRQLNSGIYEALSADHLGNGTRQKDVPDEYEAIPALTKSLTDTLQKDVPCDYETMDRSDPLQPYTQAGRAEDQASSGICEDISADHLDNASTHSDGTLHNDVPDEYDAIPAFMKANDNGLTDTLQKGVPREYETMDRIRSSDQPQPYAQDGQPEDQASSGICEVDHLDITHPLQNNVPDEYDEATPVFLKAGLTDTLQKDVPFEYETMERIRSSNPPQQAGWRRPEAINNGLTDTLQKGVPREYETMDRIRSSYPSESYTQAGWPQDQANSGTCEAGHLEITHSLQNNVPDEYDEATPASMKVINNGLTDTLQKDVPREYETMDRIRSSDPPQPRTQAGRSEDKASCGTCEHIPARHPDLAHSDGTLQNDDYERMDRISASSITVQGYDQEMGVPGNASD